MLDLNIHVRDRACRRHSVFDEHLRPLRVRFMMDYLATHAPAIVGPLLKLLSLWPKPKPPPVIQARDINITINVQVISRDGN